MLPYTDGETERGAGSGPGTGVRRESLGDRRPGERRPPTGETPGWEGTARGTETPGGDRAGTGGGCRLAPGQRQGGAGTGGGPGTGRSGEAEPRAGRAGEGRGASRARGEEMCPRKSRRLGGGSGRSRSVRKWSFNGLPSPRQICHLRRLGSSPRAVHLLITSFQPARASPASCRQQRGPRTAGPAGASPHFPEGAAKARAGAEHQAGACAFPTLPTPQPPRSPRRAGPLGPRAGSQSWGQPLSFRPHFLKGRGRSGRTLLVFSTHYTIYFTKRTTFVCIIILCLFLFI